MMSGNSKPGYNRIDFCFLVRKMGAVLRSDNFVEGVKIVVRAIIDFQGGAFRMLRSDKLTV